MSRSALLITRHSLLITEKGIHAPPPHNPHHSVCNERVRGRAPILARAFDRRFSCRRCRRLRGHVARRAARGAGSEEDRDLHRSVRVVAGERAEWRSLLRHRE